jgi:hypothetical protein
MLYYILEAHLFLQPQHVPYIKHHPSYKKAGGQSTHTSHRTVSLNSHRNRDKPTDVTGDHKN